jgi:hypothetical protein
LVILRGPPIEIRPVVWRTDEAVNCVYGLALFRVEFHRPSAIFDPLFLASPGLCRKFSAALFGSRSSNGVGESHVICDSSFALELLF